MVIVVVGLGSNLGDRFATMREAITRIAARARVVSVSRVYETDPVGGPEQPAFLNAAIAVEWQGELLGLLDLLQRIELELGRTRDVRWGPRTIDLDILWAGDLRVDHERLVVPHPRLRERAFAILPLNDVAPGAGYATSDTAGLRVTELALMAP